MPTLLLCAGGIAIDQIGKFRFHDDQRRAAVIQQAADLPRCQAEIQRHQNQTSFLRRGKEHELGQAVFRQDRYPVAFLQPHFPGQPRCQATRCIVELPVGDLPVTIDLLNCDLIRRIICPARHPIEAIHDRTLLNFLLLLSICRKLLYRENCPMPFALCNMHRHDITSSA